MCSMRNLRMKIALPSWKNPRPPNSLNPLRYTRTKAIFTANCSPASVQKQWKISADWPKITTTMGIFFIALSNSLWSKLAIRPESGLEVRSLSLSLFFLSLFGKCGKLNFENRGELWTFFNFVTFRIHYFTLGQNPTFYLKNSLDFDISKKVNFVKNEIL